MIALIVHRQGQRDEVSFTDASMIAVGRAPGNALRIQDSRVSSLHGELVRRGGGWFYRDLRSTNGSVVVRGGVQTTVDGLKTAEVGLADGDALWLGDPADPVKIDVKIGPDTLAAAGEHTVVGRRSIRDETAVARGLLGASTPEMDRLLGLLRDVGGDSEVGIVLGRVARYLFDAIPQAGLVAMVVTDRPDEPALLFDRDASDPREVSVEGSAVPYPRSLVEAAVAEREAVSAVFGIANEQSHDKSLGRLGAAGAIAAPLLAGGEASGALVVLGRSAFSPTDLDRVAALAAQVGSAFLAARLLRRLRAVERRLREENRALKAQVEPDVVFTDIIGRSTAMRAVFEAMRLVMDTDATVLILGETGTGKELVARALHEKSRRLRQPFAAVNCAALSENLLESELFGHKKGSFTGAIDDKRGLFQVADKGTLFLDELGEMSLTLQAKLLRALQEGEILPVGSSKPIKVDVRIVGATHRDLRGLVKTGQFREDLFYRLNVFPIQLPPLRERRGDIGALATFLIEKYEKRFNKTVTGLTPSALAKLEAYGFPGNIRELENEMQRAVLLTPAGQGIDLASLSDAVRNAVAAAPESLDAMSDVPEGSRLKETMEQLEREVLRRALEERGWNRSQTARDLGLSRQALMVKLSKYGLEPE